MRSRRSSRPSTVFFAVFFAVSFVASRSGVLTWALGCALPQALPLTSGIDEGVPAEALAPPALSARMPLPFALASMLVEALPPAAGVCTVLPVWLLVRTSERVTSALRDVCRARVDAHRRQLAATFGSPEHGMANGPPKLRTCARHVARSCLLYSAFHRRLHFHRHGDRHRRSPRVRAERTRQHRHAKRNAVGPATGRRPRARRFVRQRQEPAVAVRGPAHRHGRPVFQRPARDHQRSECGDARRRTAPAVFRREPTRRVRGAARPRLQPARLRRLLRRPPRREHRWFARRAVRRGRAVARAARHERAGAPELLPRRRLLRGDRGQSRRARAGAGGWTPRGAPRRMVGLGDRRLPPYRLGSERAAFGADARARPQLLTRSFHLSRMAVTPIPPAAQIEIRPRPEPRSASCFASVATMRAPVAANGWPSATLEPLGFIFARSILPSASLRPSRLRQ